MIPNRPDPERAGRVPDQAHGQRLDKALPAVFPELAGLGLRARRRLCERGLVLLREQAAGPAAKVRAGDTIRLRAEVAPDGAVTGTAPGDTPWEDKASGCEIPAVVLSNELFAALYKPRGLHSVSVAGSAAPSLEALLPGLSGFLSRRPGWRPQTAPASSFPRLLNRLDRDTSGLVLAARSEAGARLWRAAESAGRIDKRYLAVLEGELTRYHCVRSALDTADRRVSRVCADPDPSPLRHTEITPLGTVPSDPLFPAAALPLTLAGCRIRKGARHQIRAHLASIGHPLAGDALYGALLPGPYRLHHALLDLPGFRAFFPPPWLNLLPPELAAVARWYLARKK